MMSEGFAYGFWWAVAANVLLVLFFVLSFLSPRGKWEWPSLGVFTGFEAQGHFKRSNQYLKVVTQYLPQDEAARDVYDDHWVIFVPNLLMADNELRLAKIYKKLNMKKDIYWAVWQGRRDLSQSLKSVKTEWALEMKKEFEEELAGKRKDFGRIQI
jgi:hypothetical protein